MIKNSETYIPKSLKLLTLKPRKRTSLNTHYGSKIKKTNKGKEKTQ